MNREDFLMLNQNIVYFDSGATTLKPKILSEAISNYYNNYSANAHRGDYDISLRVDREFENTRRLVKELLNAKDAKEIVFTSGATDSLNKIINGFFKHKLKKGDEILLTKSEHASNILPWFELAEELSRANMGGTSINAAFNLITKDNKKYDRIIILSDNECNTRSRWGRGWTEQSYQEYIRKVASPYVYCIDFAAYGTVPLKNDGKVNYYFGYGYSMFNDISSKEFNPEAHLNEVKKIVI